MVTKDARLQTRFNSTPGKIPLPSDLIAGELAVNVADKVLFSKDSGGNIIELTRLTKQFVTDFAVVDKTGVADSRAGIIAAGAANVGRTLFWPAGTYRVSDTLTFTTHQEWRALGKVKVIFDKTAGAQASPIVDFQNTVTIVGDFDFDHGSPAKGFTDPSDPIYGSAVCVQGDNSLVDGISIRNSWDNGLSVYRSGGTGQPKSWRVRGVLTFNCGKGTHGPSSPTPGQAGGGVDIAGGAAGTISDCVDIGSNAGFIFDIGGGAQCVGTNLQSWYATRDPAYTTGHGGIGFYVGSPDTQLVNCTAVSSDWYGFWLDGPGTHSNHVNLYAYGCREIGFLIKQLQCNLTNLRAKDCGNRTPNTYPAILVDATGGNLVHLSIVTAAVEGTSHKYAIEFTRGATSNTINGEIIGGTFSGVTDLFKDINLFDLRYMIPMHGLFRWVGLPDATQVVGRPSGSIYRDANGFLKAL